FHVTGVQTCALPISPLLGRLGGSARARRRGRPVRFAGTLAVSGGATKPAGRSGVGGTPPPPVAYRALAAWGQGMVVQKVCRRAQIGRASCRERGGVA